MDDPVSNSVDSTITADSYGVKFGSDPDKDGSFGGAFWACNERTMQVGSAGIIALKMGYTQTELQAALDDLNTQGGGLLLVPPSSLEITSTVTIYAKTRVIGNRHAVYWYGNINPIVELSGDQIVLDGIRIVQQYSSGHAVALQIDGVFCTVVHCSLECPSAQGYIINLVSGSDHFFLCQNKAYRGYFGFRVNSSDYGVISGNIFYDPTYSITIYNSAYISITGNVDFSCSTNSFYGYQSNQLVFTGNACTKNCYLSASGSACNYCVVVANKFVGSVAYGGTGNVVANNGT